MHALTASPAPPSADWTDRLALPVNRTDLRVERGEYHPGPVEKSLVVVHGTADGSARSAVRRWNEAPARIGAAIVVERDGTVYETFDPDGWAIHVGSRSGTQPGGVEQRSVAVELANWGALTRTGGRAGTGFVSYSGHAVAASRVVELAGEWRGVRYAERYPEVQVEAAVAVVAALAERYGLSEVAADPFAGDVEPRQWDGFEGVVAHCHLRRKATDVHPGFPWGRIGAAVGQISAQNGLKGVQSGAGTSHLGSGQVLTRA